MRIRTIIFVLFVAGFAVACKNKKQDDEPTPAPQKHLADSTVTCDTSDVRYAKDIVPILSANCFSCHSGAAPTSGLDMTKYSVVRDLALNDGHYLLNTVNGNPDYVYMPPKPNTKLTNCEVLKIKSWVEHGAIQN